MAVRTFVAVKIPCSNELRSLKGEIDRLKGKGLRPVDVENLHITLKFLGDIDEGDVGLLADAIEGAMEGMSAFTAHLKGTGVFPSRKMIKVLWVGLEEGGEELRSLSRDINEALKPLGHRPSKFDPHVTMARIKTPRLKADINALLDRFPDRSFGTFTIDTVILMKSYLTPSGPIYTPLRKVRLGEGEA